MSLKMQQINWKKFCCNMFSGYFWKNMERETFFYEIEYFCFLLVRFFQALSNFFKRNIYRKKQKKTKMLPRKQPHGNRQFLGLKRNH